MTKYEPTLWVDDETPVSAANLNHMEQGVADLSFEDWHAVGDSGEPVFADANWQPNVQIGDDIAAPAFRTNGAGDVQLRGQATTTIARAFGFITIFTLPVDYQPEGQQMFTVAATDPSDGAVMTALVVRVGTDGQVVLMAPRAGFPAGSVLDLSGIAFSTL